MVVSEKSIRRPSCKPGMENGDENWMDADLADDATWKRMQENTFTRWANEHLKTVNKYVACLESDFSDGIRLLALVEVLSGKKLPKYNTRPTMKAQKLNNVDTALRFLAEEEKIKLVNISSSDIVEGNLKLILGLMWTLILHYSISMPVWEGEDDFDPSLTPKQRLLKWIQNKVPDVPVNNFTTDWNDGKAIGALIDSVAPGLCPDWKNWKPEDNVKNVAEALKLADDWLEVPQLITAKEMTMRKVDELSMMTYLSQFPMAKVKQDAPLRASGCNPQRVRCYGPGLQPTGVVVGAETHFTIETFSAGQGDVLVVIENPTKLEEPVQVKYNDDKNMTYTCTYTATMEGEHKITVKFNNEEVPKSPFSVSVKGVPGDHKKVYAKGPGIEPSGKVRVGQQTYIDIFTSGAGGGQVEVIILDPEGKPNTCPCRLRQTNDGQYRCEYVAEAPGLHSINIFFAGKPIPKSPFGVKVEPVQDSRKVKATGRGLQATGIRKNEVAEFKVSIDGAGDGELDIKLINPDGKQEKINIRQSSDNARTFECDYKPESEGRYVVTISFGGQEILRSPFEVHVGPESSSRVQAYGPGLHGGAVNQAARFRVDTNGETGTLGFTIEGPSEAKIECKDNGDGTADVAYYPTAPGEYAVHVMSNGEDIPKSPYCAQIVPKNEYNQEKFDSWYNKTFQSDSVSWNKSASDRRSSLTKSTTTYHEQQQVTKTKRTTTKTSSSSTSSSSSQVTTSSLAGSAAHSPDQFNLVEVHRLPITSITTTSTTTANADGLSGSGGDAATSPLKQTEPSIDLSQVKVAIKLPNGELDTTSVTSANGLLVDNGDGTVSLKYQPNVEGQHQLQIYYNDKPIPGSPFNFYGTYVTRGKVSAFGPGLIHGNQNEPCHFTIYSKGAGPGGLNVAVDGPAKCEIECVDNKDGTIGVTYYPIKSGDYRVQVKFGDNNIDGSPFIARISGDEKKPFKSIVAGKPSEVIIKVSNTELSQISANIESPSGKVEECSLKLAEDNSGNLMVSFTALEPGQHLVHVKRNGQPVAGSPFKIDVVAQQVSVGDATKVKVNGDAVKEGKINITNEFYVDTRHAGQGKLGLSMQGPSKAEVKCSNTPEGIIKVTYTATQTGTYTINVRYAGEEVPGSPFSVKLSKPLSDEAAVDGGKNEGENDGETNDEKQS